MPNLGCMVGTAYQTMLSRLDSALAEKGLDITTGEYLVLRAVFTGDGMQQCDIASLIGKDKSAVCRTVSALARKGLVRTEAVSHKCQRVYLTERGKEIEPKVMQVAHERHQALTSMLTSEELATFSTILEKIINEI